MKLFVEPEIEVIEFSVVDVLTASAEDDEVGRD